MPPSSVTKDMASVTAANSGVKPKLTLYIDIRSGYSYIAFTVLRVRINLHHIDIHVDVR